MGGGWLLDLTVSFVTIMNDGCRFLGEYRDEIRLAVAVEIGDANMHAAVARIDDARHKFRIVPIRRLIFEIHQLAGRLPAEHARDQIFLADAAKIGSLHVGHATDIFEQRVRRKGAVGPAAQPHDAAATAIRRRIAAEIRHENIENAIAIEIENFGLSAMRSMPGWRNFWMCLTELIPPQAVILSIRVVRTISRSIASSPPFQ